MSDVILATKAYVDSKLDGGGGGTPVDPLEYRDLLHWSPEGTERTVQQLLAGVRFVYGLPRKLKEITFDTAPVDFSGAVLNVYVRAASAADSFELLMEGLPATEGNLTFVFPEGLTLEAYNYTFLFEVLFPTPRTAWVQEGLIVSPYHGHDLREHFDFIACGANAEALDVNTISLPSLPNNLSFRMNMGCATEIPVPIPWGKALKEGDFPQVNSSLTALGWPEQHDFRKPSVFHEPVHGPEPLDATALVTRGYVDGRLPVGFIALWPQQTTTPNGLWLPCDGRSLMKGDFPVLSQVLGPAYDDPADSSMFRVPDLTGVVFPGVPAMQHVILADQVSVSV